jgi:acetyl esterase/lipase
LHAPLDLERVSFLGHSAGGHLALWAATRERLPAGAPGAQPGIEPHCVVAQAGVCDLSGAYELRQGGTVAALMGGSPAELPERYALGDPLTLAPPRASVLLVHGVLDETVSVKLSRRYAQRCKQEGATVELVELEGNAGAHRAHLDPRGPAWSTVTRWLGPIAS